MWHYDIVVLWNSSIVVKRKGGDGCGIVALWYSGILALWYCGIVVKGKGEEMGVSLGYCDIVVTRKGEGMGMLLWYCGKGSRLPCYVFFLCMLT